METKKLQFRRMVLTQHLTQISGSDLSGPPSASLKQTCIKMVMLILPQWREVMLQKAMQLKEIQVRLMARNLP